MALIRKEEPIVGLPDQKNISQTHTILGPESSFDGKLTFQGSVRIDGKFQGEIYTEDVLVVGEPAEVLAEVNVGTLILNGTIRGNVYAKKGVELQAPARMYGDIETPSLIVQKGVIFEGSCRMENFKNKNVSTRNISENKGSEKHIN